MEPIEETCNPYGPKLFELTTANDMDQDALLRIVEDCPNVLLDFAQYNMSYTETAIALGRAASSWMTHYSDRDCGVLPAWDRLATICRAFR